ncbi:MAG: hypothetical protein EOO40_00565 [Deltaproteobacteria bacterium]|nr:MAG: hypothetical protein EOO40_00565 [Deltaproteobacteria bacterium]
MSAYDPDCNYSVKHKQQRSIVALGCDPGMAHTGLSVVRRLSDGRNATEALVLVESKPDSAQETIGADDARRMKAIHQAITQLVARWCPDVIAIESYAPIMGKQGGSAWKTSMVYGMIYGLALSANRPVTQNRPQDIKRAFAMAHDRSKLAVQTALCGIVPNLDVMLQGVCAGKREHLADATAHAMLALDSLAQEKAKKRK